MALLACHRLEPEIADVAYRDFFLRETPKIAPPNAERRLEM